uniref:Integrase core domain containing protein n=1 Tax=Solanum tuberosum TaxID=4113 RepID=M1BIC4_SOLTU
MGRHFTVGYLKGHIKFCGQVLLVVELGQHGSKLYLAYGIVIVGGRDDSAIVTAAECQKLMMKDQGFPTSLSYHYAKEDELVRKEPQVEVPPLGDDLADTVGLAQGGDPSILDHTNIVPASSSQAASMVPSSSRSTPQLGATVVPLARVQKLEAQMATLLHHIQPWMQMSIAESEARMERRMEGMMDRKVQAVNKRLDAFELRVLELSAPAIDLSSLQAELASLRTDVNSILVAPTVEP